MKRTLIAFLAAVLVFSAMLLPSALPAVGVTEGNLLANPGAETGDMSGWTILENGGYGWNTRGTGYEGENSFSTSYEWCKRYQEIDLLAKGYSAFQLDADQVFRWKNGLLASGRCGCMTGVMRITPI